MTDPVWSVNILIALGLLGAAWMIYYILTQDDRENVPIQDQEDQQDH
jgi:hypothetical protein